MKDSNTPEMKALQLMIAHVKLSKQIFTEGTITKVSEEPGPKMKEGIDRLTGLLAQLDQKSWDADRFVEMVQLFQSILFSWGACTHEEKIKMLEKENNEATLLN